MSSSKSQQQQQQQFTDNRAVLGEGALQATTGGVVNSYVLDNGAIGRSFDTTDKAVQGALQFGSDALAGALTLGNQNVARVLDATANTQELVATAYEDAKGRGALTDKILIGAIIAIAVVAFAAVKKG